MKRKWGKKVLIVKYMLRPHLRHLIGSWYGKPRLKNTKSALQYTKQTKQILYKMNF